MWYAENKHGSKIESDRLVMIVECIISDKFVKERINDLCYGIDNIPYIGNNITGGDIVELVCYSQKFNTLSWEDIRYDIAEDVADDIINEFNNYDDFDNPFYYVLEGYTITNDIEDGKIAYE